MAHQKIEFATLKSRAITPLFVPQQLGDLVLSLDVRNTSAQEVALQFQLLPYHGETMLGRLPLVMSSESATELTIPPKGQLKHPNISCPAGQQLVVRASEDGLQACAYMPVLYVQPGQVAIKESEVALVTVNFSGNFPGAYKLKTLYHQEDLNLNLQEPLIESGKSVTFAIYRKPGSKRDTMVHFFIESLRLTTSVKVEYVHTEPVSTFEVDLAAIYRGARGG